MVQMIVSVSRRCDIPRFSFNWFLERLNAGFVEVSNPFNPTQKKQVSLRPGGDEGAELFVFWTRDPASILEHAGELEARGCPFYVMTTVTSYPALLEPNVPPADAVIQTMEKLAKKIPAERIIWRYDPLFLSNLTNFEFHLKNFSCLAARLNSIVNRVIVSVYDEYRRAERRLALLEQDGSLKCLAHYHDPDDTGRKVLSSPVRGLLAEFARIAGREGMEIQSCAEEDLSDCGIRPGACIDGEYISKVFGLKTTGRDRSQKRPGCLCAKSVDIGVYSKCPAGCVYCYASS